VAGAVAVAAAGSVAAAGRLAGTRPKPGLFLDAVLASTPDGQVRRGIARARRMLHRSVEEVAYELGSGHLVTAQDTVPFTLWVAARRLGDYRQAICDCVRAGGDVDTTSAIVGGIVTAFVGAEAIPGGWRAAGEPLPGWLQL
jgi:ADP-ribosylglycohydrolase